MRERPEAILRHVGIPSERHALPLGRDFRALLRLAHPQTLRLRPRLARTRRHLHAHTPRLLPLHKKGNCHRLPVFRDERRAHHISLRNPQRILAHRPVLHQRLLRCTDLVPIQRPSLERTVAQKVLRLCLSDE